jgi:hypothetical protein
MLRGGTLQSGLSMDGAAVQWQGGGNSGQNCCAADCARYPGVELANVMHWFLSSENDFCSSNALEIPLSELVCEGLNVESVGLCWGGEVL